MTTLIIGGEGQDGRILIRKLGLIGEEFVALSKPQSNQDQGERYIEVLQKFRPDKIYNLAGFSSVWKSWKKPSTAVTDNLNQLAVLFEAIENTGSTASVLLASSSELFESSTTSINESSDMKPSSPYSITKRAAVDLAVAYREAKGFDVRVMHLFNHESPLRSVDFVTQKIAAGAAAIKLRKQSSISLGNLAISRDWGYAPDFVEAMIEVMNQEVAEDYVVGTGKLNSLEDLVRIAFEEAGLGNWEKYVEINEENLRPNDHEGTRADSSKLKKKTGWQAKKEFPEIIAEMVRHQILKQSGKSNDQVWLDGISEQ